MSCSSDVHPSGCVWSGRSVIKGIQKDISIFLSISHIYVYIVQILIK